MIVKMIEPATLSFGIYVITRSPLSIKNMNTRNPLRLKKTLCKWIKKHSHTILDVSIDEGSELILDNINHINHINHINMNPSIYFILYCVLLLYVIFF